MKRQDRLIVEPAMRPLRMWVRLALFDKCHLCLVSAEPLEKTLFVCRVAALHAKEWLLAKLVAIRLVSVVGNSTDQAVEGPDLEAFLDSIGIGAMSPITARVRGVASLANNLLKAY